MATRTEERRAIFQHLREKELAPIYYLNGPDEYLLERAIEAVIEKAIPEGPNGFNFDRFYGDTMDHAEVLEACDVMPMLASRKVVLVRDLQLANEKEIEAFIPYFENPNPITCLILHTDTSEKTLDRRKKAVKALCKAAVEFNIKGFYDNELNDVLIREARKKGMALTPAAASYLVTAVGSQLGDLVTALEKVSLFVAAIPGSPNLTNVDVPEVSEIVAETQVHTVFKLTEALGRKDIEKALLVIDGMNRAGESAIMIVAMIARHFRIVDRLHDASLQRKSQREKAAAVGVHYFYLRDYERDARIFSPEKCCEIRKRILETDAMLKSSGMTDLRLMEHLIFGICLGR